jgi:hypothetical protein
LTRWAIATSASGLPSSRSVWSLLTARQDPPGPIERVVTSAQVFGLFGLDPSTDPIEAAVGERDHLEGVDHRGRCGQHHCLDSRIDGGHVEGPEADLLLPRLGCLSNQPAVGVFAGRTDLDDLMVLHVGHPGGVVGVVRARELDERGLVEADGRGRGVTRRW